MKTKECEECFESTLSYSQGGWLLGQCWQVASSRRWALRLNSGISSHFLATSEWVVLSSFAMAGITRIELGKICQDVMHV